MTLGKTYKRVGNQQNKRFVFEPSSVIHSCWNLNRFRFELILISLISLAVLSLFVSSKQTRSKRVSNLGPPNVTLYTI